MPAEGVPLMKHEELLSFDEIVNVVKEAVALGVDKVRITGGEPLVRRGIVDLVRMISGIPGIRDFGMTSNGVYLVKYAHQLREAGLHRINISLDTLDPERFRELTRIGALSDVLAGIRAAVEAGLNPIKINCVIKESENEPDALSVAQFCKENHFELRYIREMDLEKGYFWQVKGGSGGACGICNRLRLTADGKIRPCLFSEAQYSVRELGPREAILRAVNNKPKKGTINTLNKFNNIGG
jgi:cyclic pyranopterin phosphate synthase